MRGHRRVWSIIRVLATIVMLVVLVSRVDLDDDPPDWDFDHVGWLVVALVVTLAGILLASLRWQRVLTALDLRVAHVPPAVHLPGRAVHQQLPSHAPSPAMPCGSAASPPTPARPPGHSPRWSWSA